MTVPIRSYRILRALKRYVESGRLTERQREFATALLRGADEVVGIYENGKAPDDWLIVGEHGLYFSASGAPRRIPYADIHSVEVPPKESDGTSLGVLMSDGSRYSIPVNGTDGKLRDVYEFSRFLSRVMSDLVR